MVKTAFDYLDALQLFWPMQKNFEWNSFTRIAPISHSFRFCYCFDFNVRLSRVFTTCDSAFVRIFKNQLSLFLQKQKIENDFTAICIIVKCRESVGLVLFFSVLWLLFGVYTSIINYKTYLNRVIFIAWAVIPCVVASAICYRWLVPAFNYRKM